MDARRLVVLKSVEALTEVDAGTNRRRWLILKLVKDLIKQMPVCMFDDNNFWSCYD